MQSSFDDKIKQFKLQFGNTNHIKIANLLAELNESKAQLANMPNENKRASNLRTKIEKCKKEILFLIESKI